MIGPIYVLEMIAVGAVGTKRRNTNSYELNALFKLGFKMQAIAMDLKA